MSRKLVLNKCTPLQEVSDRVSNQYKHIESLKNLQDKTVFMHRMGFTSRQIAKKLSCSYPLVLTYIKDLAPVERPSISIRRPI